jgi:hypothetical protein
MTTAPPPPPHPRGLARLGGRLLAGLRDLRARAGLAAGLMLLTGVLAPQTALAGFGGHPDHLAGYKWPWTPAPAGSRIGLHLNYERGCAESWYAAAGAAASAWQATATPLFLHDSGTLSCDTSPRLGRIKIVSVHAGPEFLGRTLDYTQHTKTVKICSNPDAIAAVAPAATPGADASPGPICTNPKFVTTTWFEQSKPGEQIHAAVVMMNLDLFSNINQDTTPFGGKSAAENVKVAVVHELGHALGLAHAGFYAVPSEAVPPYSVMDDMTNVGIPWSTPRDYDLFEVNLMYPGW